MAKKEILEQVSARSTKEQILSAYQEALTKLAEKAKQQDPIIAKQKENEVKIITKVAQNNNETILSELGRLKTSLLKQVDLITEQLVNEFNRFENIQNAIAIEQKHIEELYGIKENIHTLSALFTMQAEQKEKFELEMKEEKSTFAEEMSEKQLSWQKQQEALEMEYKEKADKLEKARKREEEEYNYTLKLSRRKDLDDYNLKKLQLEKELEDMHTDIEKRESDLIIKEAAIKDLEEKVRRFPEELSKAITETEEKITKQLTSEYNYSSNLREKEYEATRKLNEQQIIHLQSKIKEQEVTIKDLSNKVTVSGEQVQSIAHRALDTSVQRFAYNVNSESKSLEKQAS
jgi:hypothetical protein